MKKKNEKCRFGIELERLRKLLSKSARGRIITQRLIAEYVGVSPQAYQHWIYGRRGKDIDLAVIKRLSLVLDGDFTKLVRLARPDIYKYFLMMKNLD